MYYPGLYPDENKIIPYSPRKRFGFMSPSGNKIDLESMKNMPIDQIVDLYRDGYRFDNIDDLSPKIVTAQGGIYISSGAILLIGLGVLAYLYFKRS